MSADLFGEERPARRGPGGHESNSGGTDEWLTPPHVLTALGSFDLDPCSPNNRPWDTAAQHYTIADDGLRQEWVGRVWLNPPYSQAAKWLHRLAQHGTGMALLYARTDTALWHRHVWPYAAGMLFLRGRLNFHYPNGKRCPANSGAPLVLIAYGQTDAEVLADCPVSGHYVDLARPRPAGWSLHRAGAMNEGRRG